MVLRVCVKACGNSGEFFSTALRVDLLGFGENTKGNHYVFSSIYGSFFAKCVGIHFCFSCTV